MHGYKYARTAECDLVFVNSAYTGRDVEEHLSVPRERIRVAPPGVSAEYTADGERAELGRPYVLSLATLEPRKNLETLVEAWRPLRGELALAVAGAAGWGDQPLLDDAGILKLGFVADGGGAAADARRRRRSSTRRGSRASGCRSWRRWRAASPSSRPRTRPWTRPAATPPSGSIPTIREAIAVGIRKALERREELRAAGIAHAAQFTWRRCGEIHLQAFEEAVG